MSTDTLASSLASARTGSPSSADVRPRSLPPATTAQPLNFRRVAGRIDVLRYLDWQARIPHMVHRDGFSDGEKGPSVETLRLWRSHQKRPKAQTLADMCAVINATFVLKKPLKLEHLADETPMREFYDVLGIDTATALQIEFSTWAQTSRLCRSFTFESAEAADTLASGRVGHYEIRRRRLDDGDRAEDLLAMVIYPIIPASCRRTEGEVFIPCALTIRARNRSELFRYRGVLGRLSNGIEWRFFQHGSSNLDRINVMAVPCDARDSNEMKALMLTISQGPHYQPIVCELLIRRIGDLGTPAENERFLATVPAIDAR
jgi:hypothetical protein